MFYALKSKEKGAPRVTASEAYARLRDCADWGSTQRREGWICPYCRQPVFLKSPHERNLQSSTYQVEAHFCHYSTSDTLLCLLFNPSTTASHSIDRVIQGIDHKQMLSLFYSLPNGSDLTSWINEEIRNEAFLIAELLDSIGVGSIEDDEETFIWPKPERILPDAPDTLVKSVLHEDDYAAGLRCFGLEACAPLLSGPFAYRGRPNAIRRLFLQAGKSRKEYIRSIIRSGQLTQHISEAAKLAKDLLESTAQLQSRYKDITASLTLLGMLLMETGLTQSGERCHINVLGYVYFMPLIKHSMPKLEIVYHKSLKDNRPSKGIEEKPASCSRDAFVYKSRKALLIGKDVLIAAACRDEPDGRWRSFLLAGPNQRVSTDTYIAIPVLGGIFLTSRLHCRRLGSGAVGEFEPSRLVDYPLLAGARWAQRQELLSHDGRVRIDNKSLENLLCEKSSKEAAIQWRGVEAGTKEFVITPLGVLIYIAQRR